MTDKPPRTALPIPEEITFEAMLGDVNEAVIAKFLNAPYAGRYYRLKLMGIHGGVIAVGMIVLEFGVGLPVLAGPPIAMLWLSLLATFATLLAIARQRGAVQALILASPVRRLPVRYVLSARGVERNGALTPWHCIVGVARMPEITLLKLSPVEAMPIPDTRLPPDITPDALRNAVDHWRTMA